MAGNTWEQMSEEQLRQIVSNYLNEVLRCYQEEHRFWLQGGERQFERLERKASELLEAMMTSVEPGERRKAVLQVLCAQEQHQSSLPS
jgi:hypothetical protein